MLFKLYLFFFGQKYTPTHYQIVVVVVVVHSTNDSFIIFLIANNHQSSIINHQSSLNTIYVYTYTYYTMSYSDHPPIIFFSIGNPGPITRHSVGHFMLKRLMESSSTTSIKQLSNYSSYSLSVDSFNNIIYIKSNTYMNESSKAWNKFKLSKEYRSFIKEQDQDQDHHDQIVSVIILYDDFENNLGTIKLKQFKKKSNNNESHNGLKNLKLSMIDGNSNNATGEAIYLLGIGIGPKPNNNPSGEIMRQWILSPFNKQSEKYKLETESFKLLQLYIDTMIEQISNDNDGIIKDVNKFNAKMTKLWKRKQSEQESLESSQWLE